MFYVCSLIEYTYIYNFILINIITIINKHFHVMFDPVYADKVNFGKAYSRIIEYSIRMIYCAIFSLNGTIDAKKIYNQSNLKTSVVIFQWSNVKYS